MTDPFSAVVIRRHDDQITHQVESLTDDQLPPGEVLIAVQFSSLNYKDALAIQGHPGVVRNFPHIPGIDCAGTVHESSDPQFSPGDRVLVTGYDLGGARWGGLSQLVRVPADWVVPIPSPLNCANAMAYGTAGFTAAQAVAAIVHGDCQPAAGPVLVTGASGGVGSLAVAILAKLGFEVTAVSGKPAATKLLQTLGASEILSREAVLDSSTRPLLPARWAAAVDTVGGETLATIVRSTRECGVIAACGLVGGTELPLTVYPLLLRGVQLIGIDSAHCPQSRRRWIWQQLATVWSVDELAELTTTIGIGQVGERAEELMRGAVIGRTVVDLAALRT